MLRSFIHLFKDRRVRSEVVDDEPPVSTVGLIEDSVGQAQTMSSVVNEVAINLSSASAPLGESREVLLEGGQCIVSEHNSEWVEVDLSAQCAGSNEGDTCKLQLKVTGANDSEDNSDLAARRTEAPSPSHSQDVSLVDNKGTSMETCIGQQQQQDITITVQVPPPQQNNSDPHKGQEVVFPRTVSTVSTDSLAEYCRICQQPTDEPLIELGCHCRGELAKAHRTCIQQWFNNKGTNKCEVCRHVATNLPAPISQPLQNFWAWRISRSYGHRTLQRWQGRGQFHPLFAALLILVAGLMFDVLISYYLGSSALPVNIIIGVLVVLGLGTAARLIMECCHERSIRRSIRRMEMAADMDHLQLSNGL